MADISFPSDKVATFIDHLLENRDPAVVGLRRILKDKKRQGEDFPLQSAGYEEFHVENSGSRIFTEQERRVLELEKRIMLLEKELDLHAKNSDMAVKASLAQGIKQGREQGDKEGRAAAQLVCNTEIARITAEVKSTLQSVDEWKRALFIDAEHSVVHLALALARRIVAHEIERDDDFVLAIVKNAITHVVDKQKLVVRVHPADVTSVNDSRDVWLSASEGLNNIRVIPDPTIVKGGCIIDSLSGTVDARIDLMLDELREIIEVSWSARAQSNNISAQAIA